MGIVNGYDVKVRTMAAGSTMGDLVHLEDADGSYTFTRNNSEEFSYQQPLSTGDVIELVYERQLQDDGYDSDYDRQIDALLYESYNEHEVERERARLTPSGVVDHRLLLEHARNVPVEGSRLALRAFQRPRGIEAKQLRDLPAVRVVLEAAVADVRRERL